MSVDNLNRMDPEQLDQVLRAKMQVGEPAAFYQLVLNYEQVGIAQNSQDAQQRVDFLIKASKLNFAPASRLLGQWHRIGHYVDQNIEAAISFLKHAAQLNDAVAHIELANIGFQGISTEIEMQTAQQHLLKAVALNHPEAIFVQAQRQLSADPAQSYQLLYQNYLKHKHENSLKYCVEHQAIDLIQVQADLEKIADQDGFAAAMLAFSYLRQNARDKAIQYADLAHAQNSPYGGYIRAQLEQQSEHSDAESVLEFLKKAASLGHIESAYLVGLELLKQSDKQKNAHKQSELAQQAIELFRLSATAGYAPAQYSLAQCLRYGIGAEKNFEASHVWLERSAAQHYPEAQFELSMRLPLQHEQHIALLHAAAHQGHHQAMLCMAVHEQRQDNIDATIAWLEKAKDFKIPRAYFLLSEIYRHGKGVNMDVEQGIEYLKQAADLGDIDAYFALFKVYKEGLGVRKNKKYAEKYLNLAKQNQHIEAASIEM